jgi:hypothetical protein
MSNAGSRGIIYVATGHRYVAEAVESLVTLRRTNPGLPAALVTDAVSPPGDWEQVMPLADPTHSFRDKLHMRRSPWELTLFLDTDIYVAANIGLLFDLLADFDIISHQLFEGHDYELEGVPDAFPEFNTGVIGFRRSPEVQAFFDSWAMWYDRYAPAVVADQQSFRKALYHSRLRHSVLPPEYNFRPLATNFAITDLRIIHGRPLADMPALKEKIDVNLVHRAFVPRLGCVVSDHMTLQQVWRLWLATSVELSKTASRPLRHTLARLLGRRRIPRS